MALHVNITERVNVSLSKVSYDSCTISTWLICLGMGLENVLKNSNMQNIDR